MGWWEQIQNPGKIRKTKTSYGQDIKALNQKNAPDPKESLTPPLTASKFQERARPAQKPVVPGMDKYAIAAKRLGIYGPSKTYNYSPQKNTDRQKLASAVGKTKKEIIELVCQKCRYKVAVRGDLKTKVMNTLEVKSDEELYPAIQKNQKKFKCTKCGSKKVIVFKSYF